MVCGGDHGKLFIERRRFFQKRGATLATTKLHGNKSNFDLEIGKKK